MQDPIGYSRDTEAGQRLDDEHLGSAEVRFLHFLQNEADAMSPSTTEEFPPARRTSYDSRLDSPSRGNGISNTIDDIPGDDNPPCQGKQDSPLVPLEEQPCRDLPSGEYILDQRN